MEWWGCKVHVAETCDENAELLVTHVMTCPAMQPDMASRAETYERLAAKDLLPAEHVVDAGHVDAARRPTSLTASDLHPLDGLVGIPLPHHRHVRRHDRRPRAPHQERQGSQAFLERGPV